MYKEYTQEVMKELKGKKYAITNTDADGLVSLAIVQHYFPEVKFGGWYDSKDLYVAGNGNWKEYVGLDISFSNQFPVASISNHVEINCTGTSCNKDIGVGNYYDKSMFSTSLFLLASIDKKRIDMMSTEQILALLTIDATYQGWYKYDGRYRYNIRGYLNAYGLERVIEVLESTTYEEMKKVNEKYRTFAIGKGVTDHAVDEILSADARRLIGTLGLDVPTIHTDFTAKVIGTYNKGTFTEFCGAGNSGMLSNAMTSKGYMRWTTWTSEDIVKL